LYLSLESLRISGIFLQAFIPEKATELLEMLGVDPLRRTIQHAVLGADLEYGEPLRQVTGKGFIGLFPPLPVED
jgi:methionyl-tRNA synthetase